MNKRVEQMRETRAKWRALIVEYESSGQVLEEFCLAREISAHSLKKWIWRLGVEERAGFIPGVILKASPVFREIKGKRLSNSEVSKKLEQRYTLVLSNGRELRIESRDLELKQLIAELERC